MGVRAEVHFQADHPRSRGVYLAGMSTTHVDEGSSPLARGLLTPKGIDVEKERIIPARAGFTVALWRGPAGPQDHPRSRWVYLLANPEGDPKYGSSPLARGLPNRRSEDKSTLVDHPRSRGVYWCAGPLARPAGGSSPLARGLPGTTGRWCPAGGIIPARAGFTRRGDSAPEAGADHPRSRGVYPTATTPSSDSAGSSPLARGLPDSE